MEERLWTKKYLFSLLLVFGVNMGYALLNSVMAIYGSVLTSSSVVGGYMITVFTLSALFIRLFIKKLNEKINNKNLLIIGLLLIIIAAIGYCFSKKINGKYISVVVVIVGTIAAILYPMDNIEEFLYLINSVFAPMIAVMIADFFFNKKRRAVKEWDWANLAVWLIGLILYRALMHVDIIIGYTLPDIVITAVLCMVVHRILPQNHLDKAI